MANSHFPITGAVDVAVAGALGGDGTPADPLAVQVDGVTVTIVDNTLHAPSGGGGTIGGDLGSTDNVVPRSNGTGGSTLQDSALVISDAAAASGLKSVALAGSSSGATILQPTAAASGTLTLPAATDTLVGKATTDTLTNKTLTSPTLVTPTLGVATATSLAITTGNGSAGIALSDSSGPPGLLYAYDDGSLEMDADGGGYIYVSTPFSQTHALRVDRAVGIGNDPLTLGTSRLATYLPIQDGGSGDQGANAFQVDVTATDRAASDNFVTTTINQRFGVGGVASLGRAILQNNGVTVSGSGSSDNEFNTLTQQLFVNIGTGFTQTTGPVGFLSYADERMEGPIAVQPRSFIGKEFLANNYYNGDPSFGSSVAAMIGTYYASSNEATHAAADTFPVNIGLAIFGYSKASGVNGTGFQTALQIGGSVTPSLSTSLIGTAIKARNITGTMFDLAANEATDLILSLAADDGDDATDTWLLKVLASGNAMTWTNNSNVNLTLDVDGNGTFRGAVNAASMTVNGGAVLPSLSGTTGSIGGSLLASPGTTVTGTVTVAGAVVGAPVAVSASDGTSPNGLVVLSASVTSTNTVTVQLSALAAVTPTAKTYNVRVIQ